ncbi:hypothetical protein ACFL2V_22215 [Pseudomonadota bacterium]
MSIKIKITENKAQDIIDLLIVLGKQQKKKTNVEYALKVSRKVFDESIDIPVFEVRLYDWQQYCIKELRKIFLREHYIEEYEIPQISPLGKVKANIKWLEIAKSYDAHIKVLNRIASDLEKNDVVIQGDDEELFTDVEYKDGRLSSSLEKEVFVNGRIEKEICKKAFLSKSNAGVCWDDIWGGEEVLTEKEQRRLKKRISDAVERINQKAIKGRIKRPVLDWDGQYLKKAV